MAENQVKLKSDYISIALAEICMNGDAFVSEESLYKKCKQIRRSLEYPVFKAHLAEQIRKNRIYIEGRRLYAAKTWRYEEYAAKKLAMLSSLPPLPKAALPEKLTVGDITLCAEQREAVDMVQSNRLSIILGDAGCGKSTLVRGIVSALDKDRNMVLCAPTGKAARNLTERTGLTARTVHSALGMRPDEDFLEAVSWPFVRLVIVDEASMMTLEMLAGILEKVSYECRVVLIGDGNQLLSVGTGNVLPDLIKLGTPCSCLKENHRQSGTSSALLYNVVNFRNLHSANELEFDDSFRLFEKEEKAATDSLVEEAVRRYLGGESVQVLAPYRATVLSLNQEIREKVNPKADGKLCVTLRLKGTVEYREGDRVIITKNDRSRNCCNGDVGTLHIVVDKNGNCLGISIQLPDGRCPEWEGEDIGLGLAHMDLAYALTVHKSQGSEYNTILFPATKSMQSMLSRNLFYTAISRAKKQVLLYGNRQAVDVATQRTLPPRKSMLVVKTHMQKDRVA